MGGAVSAVLDLPGKVIGAAGGILGGGEGAAPAKTAEETAATSAEGPQNEAIKERAGDFATREQTLNRQAAEAGATRSGNEADTLGAPKVKKRAASRALLG